MDLENDPDIENAPSDQYLELWESTDSAPVLADFLAQFSEISSRDLADVLLVDQSHRWLLCAGIEVEWYFEQFPVVAGERELQLDLVYGEYRACQVTANDDKANTLVDRFPSLREDLERQFDVAKWMNDDGPASLDTDLLGPNNIVSTVASPSGVGRRGEYAAPLPFEDFRLDQPLGAGAMGLVYRATQLSLDKTVAVKLLGPVGRGNAELTERFFLEARALAKMSHPNIVNVHGIGRCEDDGYFLVMDFIDGADLESRIKGRPLPIDEAVGIAETVARAIDHVHARGVVHRDLKPSNIMMDADGRVIVTDFGLARQIRCDTPEMSASDQIIGTPQYMAPEQADRTIGEIGPATDVYALGGLLFSLLTGKPPVSASSKMQVIAKVISDQPVAPPREINPKIPAAIESICLKCLEKKPDRRFRSARDVEDALRAYREDRTSESNASTTETSTRTSQSTDREMPSKWWIIGTIAAVVLLALIIVPNLFPKDDRNGQADKPNPPTGQPDAINLSRVIVSWTVDVFRNKEVDQRERLTDQPAPVYTGDSVRLQVEFSNPVYAYVLWLGSDQSATLLYPQRQDARAVTSVLIPSEDEKGLPVLGTPGTELCVLLLRNEPLNDSQQLANQLVPKTKFPELKNAALVINGQAATPQSDTPTRRPSSSDLANSLRDLQGKSRPVGGAESLTLGTVAEAISKWKEELPAELGEIRYIAIRHDVPARSTVGNETKQGDNKANPDR